MKNKKYIFVVVAIAAMFIANISGAVTILLPQNPNTGTLLIGSSTTAYRNFATGTPGYVLTATGTAPYLIWAQTSSGATFTTTTINGLSDTSYTFNVAGDNGLSYSTSTGVITLTQATSSASQSGFLSSTDWSTFNNKQATISAGSNIVITGTSVAVTSTPSFASLGVTGNASINGTNSYFTVGTSTPGLGQITLRASGVGTHDFFIQDNSTPTNFIGFTAYNPSAYKNPLVQAGDAGIHFSTTTNGFFIAPYSASASGLRMATSGVVSVNSSEVITKATNSKSEKFIAIYSTSTTVWNDIIGPLETTSTVYKVIVGVKDGSVTGNIYYSTSQTAATSSAYKLFSTDQTFNSTTTGHCYTTGATSTSCTGSINASSTPGLNNWFRFYAYNASTSQLTAKVFYTEN